ncbi:L-rhamnose-proton symport protein RhaT [Nonlabens xylanidelens]|uniref:L-rhamnose-proton symport protein RhaT n=1 Tax=Nonlabens xylanidelens TaxID=191564 RepID=A0A2S6IN97_9FLAO|nr:L-rhamnose/proton symporter RhaT [Nonlabens xylanidelens]PPK95636.1 L-rhamnose-proton symport protein RhaT [Nonlabens xylanidelens]PQJ22438.1 hypothetical protein BST94_02370 [Nonlabens xylanidelens]
MENKKHYRKALLIIILVSFLLGSLFYMSNINFQLEYFNWKQYMGMMFFMGVPITITGIITIYMSRKALINRKQDDTIK